ncbi:hypothetical protein I553_4605 [Mycobacterium xenopi 4042]|uniref:Uncharacterized protein n=1 Tax=Mycobacterium xenopi 4042 TaxID=1299334 RepID=X8AH72_MYCXE|nr:hypothetical protein I553_4605 [Mycobacterium xenopi 4042]
MAASEQPARLATAASNGDGSAGPSRATSRTASSSVAFSMQASP